MFKKVIAATVALAALTGCAAPGQYKFGKLEAELSHQEATASFIQWNEDYAVTANHVLYVNDVVYTCSVGCDLKFFKHKADAPVAQWRDRVPNEKIVAVGLNINRESQFRTGKDINIPVSDSKDGSYTYYTTDARSVGGMSGGPVYGMDKKVIGMTLGSSAFEEKGKVLNVSTYLPYALVQQEWDKYQAKAGDKLAAK